MAPYLSILCGVDFSDHARMIELRASGAQAKEAMRALVDLIERKFDEE